MIHNKTGQTYKSANTGDSFYVGQEVVANNLSHYAGLNGVITQIIDGDDLETDNPGPDIYCDFTLTEEKSVSHDIGALGGVIMAPDMLEPKGA